MPDIVWWRMVRNRTAIAWSATTTTASPRPRGAASSAVLAAQPTLGASSSRELLRCRHPYLPPAPTRDRRGTGAMSSRVGIVVAAFNAGDFIAATLESIWHQSYGEWSCIVVDDGSTDDTRAIAHDFARLDERFTVIAMPNRGHCAARNTGIHAHAAHVDAITVMDADDVWLPHALDTLVNCLAQRPDCIGAHGLGDFINSTGRPLDVGAFAAFGRARHSGRSGRLQAWPDDRDSTFATIVTASTIFPPGLVLMRRSIYESIRGYDVSSVEGDWDLLIRASRHGPLAYVNEVILLYRRHAGNFGARSEIAALTRLTLIRAHESDANSVEQTATLRACWRAEQIRVMQQQWRVLSTSPGPRMVSASLARLLLAAGRYLRGRPHRSVCARVARGVNRALRSRKRIEAVPLVPGPPA